MIRVDDDMRQPGHIMVDDGCASARYLMINRYFNGKAKIGGYIKLYSRHGGVPTRGEESGDMSQVVRL